MVVVFEVHTTFTDNFLKILNLKFRKKFVCISKNCIKAIHIESYYYSSANWVKFDHADG